MLLQVHGLRDQGRRHDMRSCSIATRDDGDVLHHGVRERVDSTLALASYDARWLAINLGFVAVEDKRRPHIVQRHLEFVKKVTQDKHVAHDSARALQFLRLAERQLWMAQHEATPPIASRANSVGFLPWVCATVINDLQHVLVHAGLVQTESHVGHLQKIVLNVRFLARGQNGTWAVAADVAEDVASQGVVRHTVRSSGIDQAHVLFTHGGHRAL